MKGWSLMRKWSNYLLYPKIPVIYVVALAAAGYGLLQLPGGQQSADEVSVAVEHWLPRVEEPDSELLNADLPDFTDYTDVAERKEAFFSFVHGFVEYENERILSHRQQLEPIWRKAEGGADRLNEAERQTLLDFAERYRVEVEETGIADIARQLELRVDVIPPSLVLAQAANESAWGTSRFAREANNLFGQWCFEEGCGLVPQRRIPGAEHEVKTFDSVSDAVHAYFRNINTNEVYDYLRELRFEMRQEQQQLDSMVLAYGLTRYSQRGTEYIAELQSMIRFNNLTELDGPYQS